MEGTKIRLSPEELELVSRTDWILTKNAILLKAKALLEEVSVNQRMLMQSQQHSLPPEAFHPSAKISKGENYKGLPYLVLDQPRHFSQHDIFAIRTMFWWGNFFSVTLHVAGRWREHYFEKLHRSFPQLKEDFFIGCNEDPWEHHFDKDNYVKIDSLENNAFQSLLNERNFVKIAAKTAISNWETADKDLLKFFGRLLQVLTA